MVNADHEPLGCLGGEGGDRDTWAAAEFDDPIGWPDVEELRRLAAARYVRGSRTHDPSRDVPAGSARVEKLRRPPARAPPFGNAPQRTLFDVHITSTAFQVRSKSMTAYERAAASPENAQLLSIGELSERTGVPASTLRYYDELGLMRPAARIAGRRRYAASAVRDIGLIVAFREIGFKLADIKRFVHGERQSRRELIDRKVTELAEQQHRIQVARYALEHGLVCPADDQLKCPRFWLIIEGHQCGLSLKESHERAH
jgi:DNA-binding transcriptional MerR regulator